MKGLEVLIVLGLTCISQVKSDPLSEKLNLLSEKVPEELIQITDLNLTRDKIVASIKEILQDEAKLINDYSPEASTNIRYKSNKVLLSRCIKEMNEILKKLKNSKVNVLSLFDILNYYVQLRYHFEYNYGVLNFSVTRGKVYAFKETFEGTMIGALDALLQMLSVKIFSAKYESNNASTIRNVLIDRAVDVYHVMLEVFPFLYGKTFDNAIHRTDVAKSLLEYVKINLEVIIDNHTQTPDLNYDEIFGYTIMISKLENITNAYLEEIQKLKREHEKQQKI